MVVPAASAVKLIPGIIPSTITRLSRMPKNRFFIFISCFLLIIFFHGCYGRRSTIVNTQKPPNLTGYSNPVKSDGHPSRM